jgi:hypothetical protein
VAPDEDATGQGNNPVIGALILALPVLWVFGFLDA